MFKSIKVVFVERFFSSAFFLWFSFCHFLFLFSLVQPFNRFILLKRFSYEKILFSTYSYLLHLQEKSKHFFSFFYALFCFDFQGFNRLIGCSHGR